MTEELRNIADPANSAEHVALYAGTFRAFQNSALEKKIQELIDREEIRELIARYAHRIAQGISVADMFTDDGVFIVRFPGRPVIAVNGREKLDETYSVDNAISDHPLPMIHNVLIEISGSEAIGVCSNELRLTENGKSMIGSGYYQDRFRRENGRWKFSRRDMTFIHWVPIQQGWANADTPR